MSEFHKVTTQEEIYRRKASARFSSASRPVEEKIDTLIKLQQMTASVAKAAGRECKEPWTINSKRRKAQLG